MITSCSNPHFFLSIRVILHLLCPWGICFKASIGGVLCWSAPVSDDVWFRPSCRVAVFQGKTSVPRSCSRKCDGKSVRVTNSFNGNDGKLYVIYGTLLHNKMLNWVLGFYRPKSSHSGTKPSAARRGRGPLLQQLRPAEPVMGWGRCEGDPTTARSCGHHCVSAWRVMRDSEWTYTHTHSDDSDCPHTHTHTHTHTHPSHSRKCGK